MCVEGGPENCLPGIICPLNTALLTAHAVYKQFVMFLVIKTELHAIVKPLKIMKYLLEMRINDEQPDHVYWEPFIVCVYRLLQFP